MVLAGVCNSDLILEKTPDVYAQGIFSWYSTHTQKKYQCKQEILFSEYTCSAIYKGLATYK